MAKTIHLPCKNKPLHTAECSDCSQLEHRVENLEECCEDVNEALDGKQDTLESGVNIKTINGDSLLGSGDMVISSGGDTVSYTQTQTSGNELGTITINGTPSKIYGVDYSSKQDALVSGTNIKTVNNNSLLGSGNISIPSGDTVSYTQTQTSGDELGTITINGTGKKIYGKDYSSKQDALVSGTNIKTVNNNSLLGSGDVAVQEVLVSGTNIKTINNNSLLGSGNITISGGGGDTVSYTQTQTTGNELGTITINGTPSKIYGVDYSGKSTVSFSQTQTTGNELGTITINGTASKIYGVDYSGKQDALVSGTNIKTVDSNSLLGSGDIVTTKTWYGTCSTTASTTAKTVTCSGFTKVKGAVIAITFSTANTANAPTLNINSTTATATYKGNAVTSSSNPLKWDAGDTLTFMYDGSYYKYLSTSNDFGKQDALVSGTNIKTINNNSLLGSGDLSIPTGTTATVTQVSLTVANWNATTTCTVSVTGVTASNSVIVSPAPASIADYVSAGVYCSAQGSGTLTFTASSTPTADLTVNVMIVG